MTETVELKPCPFCGKNGDTFFKPSPNSPTGFWWTVVCNDHCLAEGPMESTEAKAIAAWNTRSDPAVRDRVTWKADDEVGAWLEAALQCKDWHWDGDQYAAAEDSLKRLQNELRTSPPEPASGWRPIETAPKDWSDVLVHVPGFDDHRNVAEAYFNPESGVWKSHASRRKLNPTHWQPLPPPPAKEPQ